MSRLARRLLFIAGSSDRFEGEVVQLLGGFLQLCGVAASSVVA